MAGEIHSKASNALAALGLLSKGLPHVEQLPQVEQMPSRVGYARWPEDTAEQLAMRASSTARVRYNPNIAFADFKPRVYSDPSSGIAQRIEYAVASKVDAAGAATFQQALDAALPEAVRARLQQALTAGVTATAFGPMAYQALHMVDAATAKRAAARLGALADSADEAQKVLGKGWTITRTSSAKIGMCGSGPIPGGDAPGYESTWAFAVAGPSGVRFGVQVSVAERRFAGQAEASGEIRTSTIEGGRLFTLAERLIRYGSAK